MSRGTGQRWPEVERLFHLAQGLPRSEWAAFLDSECRSDGDLREDVESLLAALEGPEVFSDQAAAELADDLTDFGGFGPVGRDSVGSGSRDGSSGGEDSKHSGGEGSRGTAAGDRAGAEPLPFPERLGPYRLIKVLGEGGMSTVYLAEQSEPLPRKVALKLMRWGGSPEQGLRRFELERETLARMSHPSIAQVFGAGATEHGQPYVVIEHVPGSPITEFSDSQRLTLEQRLRLFIAVCDGVRHAHEKAVIHRDLKPSNILVTEVQGRPVPKIIDFGIAKALEPWSDSAAHATHSRLRVGSPGYMSPEAIFRGSRGVDTRSDVYSLGVVLCLLLIGARPFNDASNPFLALPGGGDPPRPSRRYASMGEADRRRIAKDRRIGEKRLIRLLRGELDWIVLRAVATEPEARYGSAAELAADLERWLTDRPVKAKPPSLWYQTRKVLRRHWVASCAGLLILATVVGFSLRSQSLYRQAEAARAQSEELASFMLDDLSGQLEPLGRLDLLESVAHRALNYYESTTGTETPQTAARAATALRWSGRVLSSRGELKAAMHAHQRALEIGRRLQRQLPHDPSISMAVAEGMVAVGKIHEDRGQVDAAATSFDQAERLLRGLPDAVGPGLSLARLLSDRADLDRMAGDIDKAVERSTEAKDLLQRLAEVRPKSVEVRRALAEQHLASGLLELYSLDRPEVAAVELEQGVAIYRRLVESRPEAALWRYRLAVLLGQGLSTAYRRLGRLDDARAVNFEALSLFESLVRQEQGNSRWVHGYGWELYRQGDLAETSGDLDTSVAAFRRSVEVHSSLLERAAGPALVNWWFATAAALRGVADVELKRGRPSAAIENAEASWEMRRKVVDEDIAEAADPVHLVEAGVFVAELRHRSGNLEAAAEAVERARKDLANIAELRSEMDLEEYLAEIRERLVIVESFLSNHVGGRKGGIVDGSGQDTTQAL